MTSGLKAGLTILVLLTTCKDTDDEGREEIRLVSAVR